jgi:hypothetical protein
MFIPRDFKAELEEYLSTIERDLAATEAQAESYRKERTRVGSLLAAIRSTEEEATTPSGGPTREQIRVLFPPGVDFMTTKELSLLVYGARDSKAQQALLAHLDALDITVHDDRAVALKGSVWATRMLDERERERGVAGPIDLSSEIPRIVLAAGEGGITFSDLYNRLPKQRGGYAKMHSAVRRLVRTGSLRSTSALLGPPTILTANAPKAPQKGRRPAPRIVAALEALQASGGGSLAVRELSFAVYKDGEPGSIKETRKLIRRLSKLGLVSRTPGDLTVGTRVTITSDGASYLRTA